MLSIFKKNKNNRNKRKTCGKSSEIIVTTNVNELKTPLPKVNKQETQVELEKLKRISEQYEFKTDDKAYIRNDKFYEYLKSTNFKYFISVIDENNEYKSIPLEDAPNMLIYGTLASGKSSFVQSILFNAMIRNKFDTTKFIVVDTRQLEYTNLNGNPYMFLPVLSDPEKVKISLEKLIKEIDIRISMFRECSVKNIDEFNSKMCNDFQMKHMYLIIDELNDLLTYDKKGFKELISKILKDGRITGVYVIATINNLNYALIDYNFISYFSTRVVFGPYIKRDKIKLLNSSFNQDLEKYQFAFNSSFNKYDGIYHYVYIDDIDYDKLVTKYSNTDIYLPYEGIDYSAIKRTKEYDVYDDPLYDEVVEFAVSTGKISASLIQRKFRLGYNRAARIIDLLEERGIIGPQFGSKPREVLVKLKDD